MRGCSSTWRVTSRENSTRSTANAPPAATAWRLAAAISGDPRVASSAFKSPAALSGLVLLSELEQTSSAASPVWCTAVGCAGRISTKAHGDSARGEAQGRLAARQSCAYYGYRIAHGAKGYQTTVPQGPSIPLGRPSFSLLTQPWPTPPSAGPDAGRSARRGTGDEPVALGLGEPNHEPGERVASRSMSSASWRRASMPKARPGAPRAGLLPCTDCP